MSNSPNTSFNTALQKNRESYNLPPPNSKKSSVNNTKKNASNNLPPPLSYVPNLSQGKPDLSLLQYYVDIIQSNGKTVENYLEAVQTASPGEKYNLYKAIQLSLSTIDTYMSLIKYNIEDIKRYKGSLNIPPDIQKFINEYEDNLKELKQQKEKIKSELPAVETELEKEIGLLTVEDYAKQEAEDNAYIAELQEKAKAIFLEKKRGPLCDSEGFYQHTGECWHDAFQQVILNTDNIKEAVQYKLIFEKIPDLIDLPNEAFVPLFAKKLNDPKGMYQYQLLQANERKKWVAIYLKELQKRFLRHYITEGKRRNLNEEQCALEQPAEIAREKLQAIATEGIARKSGKEAQTSAILAKLGQFSTKLRNLEAKGNKLSKEEKKELELLKKEATFIENIQGKATLSLEQYRKNSNTYSGGGHYDLTILLNIVRYLFFSPSTFFYTNIEEIAEEGSDSIPLKKFYKDLISLDGGPIHNSHAILLGMSLFEGENRTGGHEAAFYTCGGQGFYYEDNTGIVPFPWKQFLVSWYKLGEGTPPFEFWTISLKKGSISYRNSFYPVLVHPSGTKFSTFVDDKYYEFEEENYEKTDGENKFTLKRLYHGNQKIRVDGFLLITAYNTQGISNLGFQFKQEARIKQSPLVEAIQKKNTAAALSILESSTVPKTLVLRVEGNQNVPILILAAASKQEKVVEKLLDVGFDPNVVGPRGITFLNAAFALLSGALFEKALKSGASLSTLTKLYTEKEKISKIPDYYEKLKVAFESGLDKNAYMPNFDQTLLMNAVEEENTELVKFLLEQGVDLTKRDGEGILPIHIASTYGFIDIVQLLAKPGVDIEARTPSGRTPLWLAAANGHPNVVKYLLSVGANPNVRDNGSPENNQPPKSVLEAAKTDEIREILKGYNAKNNRVNTKGGRRHGVRKTKRNVRRFKRSRQTKRR